MLNIPDAAWKAAEIAAVPDGDCLREGDPITCAIDAAAPLIVAAELRRLLNGEGNLSLSPHVLQRRIAELDPQGDASC